MSQVHSVTANTSKLNSDIHGRHDQFVGWHHRQPQSARIQPNNQSASDERDDAASKLIAVIGNVDSEETFDVNADHDHAGLPSHLVNYEIEDVTGDYTRDTAHLDARRKELQSREATVIYALWRELELPPSKTSGKFSTVLDLLIEACRELRQDYTDAFELWRQRYIVSGLIDRVEEGDHPHLESEDEEARKRKMERDWGRIEDWNRERSEDE